MLYMIADGYLLLNTVIEFVHCCALLLTVINGYGWLSLVTYSYWQEVNFNYICGWLSLVKYGF